MTVTILRMKIGIWCLQRYFKWIDIVGDKETDAILFTNNADALAHFEDWDKTTRGQR